MNQDLCQTKITSEINKLNNQLKLLQQLQKSKNIKNSRSLSFIKISKNKFTQENMFEIINYFKNIGKIESTYIDKKNNRFYINSIHNIENIENFIDTNITLKSNEEIKICTANSKSIPDNISKIINDNPTVSITIYMSFGYLIINSDSIKNYLNSSSYNIINIIECNYKLNYYIITTASINDSIKLINDKEKMCNFLDISEENKKFFKLEFYDSKIKEQTKQIKSTKVNKKTYALYVGLNEHNISKIQITEFLNNNNLDYVSVFIKQIKNKYCAFINTLEITHIHNIIKKKSIMESELNIENIILKEKNK